jgi:hypothetical protein
VRIEVVRIVGDYQGGYREEALIIIFHPPYNPRALIIAISPTPYFPSA